MRKSTIMTLRAALAVALTLAAFSPAVAWWGADVKGSGNVVSEERSVADFRGIAINGSADVVFSVGPTRVVVFADDNILELIETEVRDGVLEIGSRGSYSTRKGVRLEISAPSLDSLAIRGSGDFETKDELAGESFTVEVLGSGDVHARGRVAEVSVSVRGSGDVDLRDLRAARAHVRVAGSGDVMVHASEAVDVSVKGSGDIDVYGKPASVEKSSHGSGDVTLR